MFNKQKGIDKKSTRQNMYEGVTLAGGRREIEKKQGYML